MFNLRTGGVRSAWWARPGRCPRTRGGPVYTPPYLRGKGYATAGVALLSRIILGKGNVYCALFADLENPVSNGIYRRSAIGRSATSAKSKYTCSRLAGNTGV
jgi:predicted GNAT family acetyltransferase